LEVVSPTLVLRVLYRSASTDSTSLTNSPLLLVVKNLVPTGGGVKAAAQACPPNSMSDAPQKDPIKRFFMIQNLEKNIKTIKFCYIFKHLKRIAHPF
jgi:hypothetical protein